MRASMQPWRLGQRARSFADRRHELTAGGLQVVASVGQPHRQLGRPRNRLRQVGQWVVVVGAQAAKHVCGRHRYAAG